LHVAPTSSEERNGHASGQIDLEFDGQVKLANMPLYSGFSVAGEDRWFYPAKARQIAKNKVEVWNEDVPEPVAARYAWAVCPVGKLRPVMSPFRTDDWPAPPDRNGEETGAIEHSAYEIRKQCVKRLFFHTKRRLEKIEAEYRKLMETEEKKAKKSR